MTHKALKVGLSNSRRVAILKDNNEVRSLTKSVSKFDQKLMFGL